MQTATSSLKAVWSGTAGGLGAPLTPVAWQMRHCVRPAWSAGIFGGPPADAFVAAAVGCAAVVGAAVGADVAVGALVGACVGSGVLVAGTAVGGAAVGAGVGAGAHAAAMTTSAAIAAQRIRLCFITFPPRNDWFRWIEQSD